ncbi:MAG: aspartyl protease family protein [Steroidobacteraceae bacterium]
MNRTGAVLPIRCLQWMLLIGFVTLADAQQPATHSDAQQPATHSGDDTLFASPTRKDHIGRIVVPVMINGQGPFRFIVDTGASHSTVSPQLAVTLGLQPTDDSLIKINGITGTAQVPSVVIDKLKAGDLIYKDARLPIVWAPLMAGADGILGVAGLKTERLLVDFVHDRVTISRAGVSTPLGFVRIPALRLTSGLITVDGRVGGIRVRAVVDTGSERSLGNLALRDALHGWRHSEPAPKVPKVTEVYGSTSDIVQGEMIRAPVISLGPVKIAGVTLIFGDFHIFEVWNMEAKPALIIGMDILGSVRSLGIDYRSQDLYLEGIYLGVRTGTRLP